jgi:glycosyltransferase involved in cell wall biosynthesis
MPRVSVLLPVRDGGSTLASAIRSVLEQTFADFELLVLDDGSSDASWQIASSTGDARVRAVRDGRQLGLARRLNTGIEQADSEYIARMDADDLCFPERFARQVRFLDAHRDIDLLGCRAVAFRDGVAIGLLPFAATHEEICARPWTHIHLPHPTWMGRTQWFRRHRYAVPEVRRAEDQDLLLRTHRSSRFACLPDVLLAYRQGRFDVRRNLLARRQLFAAQRRDFAHHREWPRFARSAANAAVKIAADTVAALPGCDRLYFGRMGEPVPGAVRAQLALWGVRA